MRVKALAIEPFEPSNIVRLAVRPFDTRWAYWSSVGSLWNRSRPSLWKQHWPGNKFFVSRRVGGTSSVSSPTYLTSALTDGQVISVNPAAIPIFLRSDTAGAQAGFFSADKANLSALIRGYLQDFNLPNPDTDPTTAELIWMHALAIGYSPAYLTDNADGIRENWPRIPLPASRDALLASAALGREVAALLDTETPVPGVTSGALRPELKDHCSGKPRGRWRAHTRRVCTDCGLG